MDFNFSQNMIRNDSIFQTTGTEIGMSSERALKLPRRGFASLRRVILPSAKIKWKISSLSGEDER
jgi:hypothetical protein